VKKIFIVVALFGLIFLSCEKEIDISGTYSGEIEAKLYANSRVTERIERFKINILMIKKISY